MENAPNVLEVAEGLVSKRVPPFIRDDIVQEVALVILEGRLSLDSPSAMVRKITNKAYASSPLSFRAPLSLDKPHNNTGRTIEQTYELHLPICNTPQKRRAKVYKQDWYKDKEHLEGSFGRPRTWFYTNTLRVFRCYHDLDRCGMGGGWSQRRFVSLHAECPNCQNYMHMWGNYPVRDGGMIWSWVCRICGAHVRYQGSKYWSDRLPSPIIDGKRVRRRVD